MRHKVVMFVALLAMTWCWICEVRAQPGTPNARAKQLYRRANKALAGEKYDQALAMFLELEKTIQTHKVVYKIAVTLDRMGRHPKAATRYEQFLALAREVRVPRKLSQMVRLRIEQLKRSLASLQVLCSVNGATIMLDKKEVGRTPHERRIYLTPGTRELSVSKEGFSAFTKQLELGRGHHEEVQVALEKINNQSATVDDSSDDTNDDKGAVTSGQSGAVTPSRPEPPRPARPGPEPSSARRTWGKVAVGGGVTLLVTAGLLYVLGSTKGSAAHEDYMQAKDHEDIARHWGSVQTAETMILVGHVLAGVSVAALGTAAYLFLSDPAAREQTSAAGLSVGMCPTMGGATLSVSGRY